ncbi:zinc-binding dehydrogenase [Sinosporangium siamense]|uniref:zinc-binding dehydrogenase n=1 Tax=Sinosporangium siamense TaxID=1367973 RepID=UPI00194F1674|nr:zinc-binding dehydrogenase [Sinosporangium siamense]
MSRGAGRVWVADHHPDRLRVAEEMGATPINPAEQHPVEVVKETTLGMGADNGCECVGYQAHDPQGREDAGGPLNTLIDAVRFTGSISAVGVFVPHDPGAAEMQGQMAAEGKVPTGGSRLCSTRTAEAGADPRTGPGHGPTMGT